MSRDSLRKHLSMPGMLQAVRACLHRIADPVDTRGISLSDYLMPGLTVFASRTPSLLRSGRQHPCLESSPDPAFFRLFCGFSAVPCPAVPDLSTAFPTGGAVRARRKRPPGRPRPARR